MGQKFVIGPLTKGLRNDVTAFNIDDDSFPSLINAYQWRGRVKRKRGTSLLGRLQRYFNSASSSYGSITAFNLVAGAGNLLTAFSLQTNGNIIPGSVHLTDATTGNVFTDNSLGILTGVPGGTGTINYATGAITIAGGGADTINAVSFLYYPDLPVMGLEDFVISSSQFPGTIAFDTKYSYNIVTADPYPIYDVSFYKNPPTGTYVGYTEKTNITPTSWNGQDYQQFWTTNYQGALWTTNGITQPFSPTNVGMQFKPITVVDNITAGPPALADLTIANHGLVVGDFVFINEVLTTTGINFQTGYVTAVVSANKVTVEFPNATIATNGTAGIAQYLTSRSDPTKDCLRWYDGDPTNGSATAPVLNGHLGWVNFAPPLSDFPLAYANYTIADLPIGNYYLVGAKMIVPFKDRLLFIGPVVQTSSGTPKYLQDTVIYSQNGTPYYTASFTGDPASAATVFNPILVPVNQTATPPSYWGDVPGFGGWITAGVDQEATSASNNEDVLIIGFTRLQTRFVYSGSELLPFNFFIINSELGTTSTFSAINLDRGVITRGSRGFIITGQTESRRIDLQIPDQVFQTRLSDNGTERVCAQRDFISEWIYFTYPAASIDYKFPTETLQYNYRDDSWAIFLECYTTYGLFRKQTGFIWQTVGLTFPTWSQWNEPWNAGVSNLLQPLVIAGNQQGFVMIRNVGTSEGTSLYIRNVVGNLITSPNHCLNEGDFIYITGCIGISNINGRIFRVQTDTVDTFYIFPEDGPDPSGTYLGGGLIQRMYIPFVQTKQFPVAWGISRKVRLGVQQYLLTATQNSQITLLIFLSQNSDSPYNSGNIIPQQNVFNSSLVYSTILYTCPESTNLGLTPANTNLQLVTAEAQAQIWHRINTSLLGDTVQMAFTLSETQMFSTKESTYDITGATQAAQCVLTCENSFFAGQTITITGVVGMTQLNNNSYTVVSATTTTVTINVNSTGFTAYVSGGIASAGIPIDQFAEIELHAIVIDVTPSQLLV